MNRFVLLLLCVLLVVASLPAARAQPAETVTIGKVTGTVVLPDGSPAAGARVAVIVYGYATATPPGYTVLWRGETSAKEDGSFSVQPAPVAREELTRMRVVHIVTLITHDSAGFTAATAPRRGEAVADPVDTGTLHLLEPSTLSGTLTDTEGTPLARATLRLSHWSQPLGGAYVNLPHETSPLVAQTDSEGNFTFERVPKPGELALVVEKQGFPKLYVSTKDRELRVQLPHPGSLVGRVVDEGGSPVPDCRVLLAYNWPERQARERGGPLPQQPVTTDSEGGFRFSTLFPGAYDLRVDPPEAPIGEGEAAGWASALLYGLTVTSGQVTDVESVTLRPGAVLAGQVRNGDTDGPLPDVDVSAYLAEVRSGVGYWRTTTNATGRYQLLLPGGRYQVRARKVDFITLAQDPGEAKEVTLEPDDRFQECDFVLHPAVTVRARLLLPDGSPATACFVYAQIPSGRRHAITDGSGWFRLEQLRPGDTVTLSVTAPEHGAELDATFTVAPDVPEETFTMKAVDVCTVTGKVLDDTGEPVRGQKVYVMREEGSQSQTVGSGETNEKGRFTIRALGGGSGRITFEGYWSGPITENMKLELEAGAVEMGDFEVPRLESEVAGVVVDIDGEPVAGCVVNARGVTKRGASAQVRTGEDGTFHFKNLPNDSIAVDAWWAAPGDNIVRHQTREAVPAGTMDVRLVLGLRQRPEPVPPLSLGDQAPDLVLEEGGPRVSLVSLKGRPVLVVFVSVYSRPCANALLELKALQEETGADRLAIVAVHDRTATPEEIEGFRKDHGISFPILRVPQAERDGWDSNTFHAYGVKALPTTFLIDYNGKVAAQGTLSSLAEKLTQLPE